MPTERQQMPRSYTVTYGDDPEPAICFTRIVNKHVVGVDWFDLATAKLLLKDLQSAINAAE